MAKAAKGKVRALGHIYVDGFEQLEIHLKKEESQGLPYQEGQRVPIILVVHGKTYKAGLRSTRNCVVVWVSPDLLHEDGQKIKLAHVLHGAGIQKNQEVELEVVGSQITVTAI